MSFRLQNAAIVIALGLIGLNVGRYILGPGRWSGR